MGKFKDTHILKTVQPYFDDVKSGKKKFDLRKDDRKQKFEVGHTVILFEYNPITDSYGDSDPLEFKIDYILRDAPQFGLMEGYCILSLSPINT